MAFSHISVRLKQLRMEKGLTQAQVAKRICVTRSALAAYESGARCPSYDVLVSLSYLYMVSTDYLLCKEERRFIDVSGLNDEECAAIVHMVSLLLQPKKTGGRTT